MKPDLIITAVTGLQWPHLRPFANSIIKSGFQGEAVFLVHNVDAFTQDCLRARDFTVVPFSIRGNGPMNFVTQVRFLPLVKFLEKYGDEYRYVIWVDATDQVFQRNPSDWFDEQIVTTLPLLVAARECWRIKDETRYNDPWLSQSFPAEYDWLREQEIVCGGTVAGDAETMLRTMKQISKFSENPEVNDQSSLAYVVHKPFNFPVPTRVFMPIMQEGWCATCSAFKTAGFQSIIGIPDDQLTDTPPVFDQHNEVVLTPDGKTPFVLVHQYNRDVNWIRIMHSKYGDLR
jgi:hypothetical protein